MSTDTHTCSVDGCMSPYFARGFCQRHRRHAIEGRPLTSERLIFSRNSEADFWARVDRSGDCWEWKRGLTTRGYGKVHLPEGRTGLAHRRAYELVKGPIPDGLVLDHLCRNPRCVNPDHLEAVTVAVNTQRGASSLDFDGRCRSGRHEVRDGSSRYPLKSGKRTCLECKREGESRRRSLLRRAAARLGLSTNAYAKRYGMSTSVALEILGEAAHAD